MTSVKVRIAVAVDNDGDWYAVGWLDAEEGGSAKGYAEDELAKKAAHYFWVTAELPIPEPVEVEGTVEG